MVINSRIFGEIEIDEKKIIFFGNGIVGFPELKNFVLVHDEENALPQGAFQRYGTPRKGRTGQGSQGFLREGPLPDKG